MHADEDESVVESGYVEEGFEGISAERFKWCFKLDVAVVHMRLGIKGTLVTSRQAGCVLSFL